MQSTPKIISKGPKPFIKLTYLGKYGWRLCGEYSLLLILTIFTVKHYYPSEHINTFLFNFSYKKYIYNSIHLDLSRFVRTSRTIFFFPDISLTFWLYDSISQFNFHPSLRNKIQKNFFYKFYRTWSRC